MVCQQRKLNLGGSVIETRGFYQRVRVLCQIAFAYENQNIQNFFLKKKLSIYYLMIR